MDAPPLDETLRQAFAGIDNDDVRLFYEYLDELKQEVRRRLPREAQAFPGSSAIAQSALGSMLADLAWHRIPLSDTDEFGYPMLWPLLLKYVERHCNKWRAYYRTKKRSGQAVPLQAVGELRDHRESATSEEDFISLCTAFFDKLDPLDQRICQGRLENKSLAEIAAEVGYSDTTVSKRLRRIRDKLETL